MSTLTREQLLEQKLRTERVEIPWADGAVIVRAMSYRLMETCRRKEEDKNFNEPVYLFVHCLIDEKGDRIWNDEDLKIVEETVDVNLIQLVYQKACALATMSPEKLEALKKSLRTTPVSAVSGG